MSSFRFFLSLSNLLEIVKTRYRSPVVFEPGQNRCIIGPVVTNGTIKRYYEPAHTCTVDKFQRLLIFATGFIYEYEQV
jgi:hypothetical protein